MNKLHVVGIGLDGLDGLSQTVRALLNEVPAIAAPRSHLNRVIACAGRKLQLPPSVGDWAAILRRELQQSDLALLATGDPLFFGIGRLLTRSFPAEQLVFYPHISCIQLAFSRLQIPWQSATVASIHGRSLDNLIAALKQGKSPIAILTDSKHSPSEIANLIQQLQLPTHYRISVCCNLGGPDEFVETFEIADLGQRKFPQPNVAILQRAPKGNLDLDRLPVFGISDRHFLTFPDRPGLITKQEVRALSLSLLQLPTGGILWDVGAGTGSMSVEMARLVPQAKVFAVEKDAAGIELIAANARRFNTPNLQTIAGSAPAVLATLPPPDRIFLGGGGPNLPAILQACTDVLIPGGAIVGNFATLESLNTAQKHFQSVNFCVNMLQVNLSRSVAIAQSTRFAPLNPVTLLQALPLN